MPVSFASSLATGLSGLAAAAVALGFLIFFHEFGHFIVAKLSGVAVQKFSLGFGKKLFGWKVGETDYMVSVLPLGGYVKMLGEDEGAEELSPEDKKRSFSAQPGYKRALIVFAGPFFNIVLAVILCYIVLVTGFPQAIARVAGVAPGSPAAVAGFMPGDIVEKIDGNYVDFWQEVADYVKGHPGKAAAFTVRRGDRKLEIKATPELQGKKVYLGLLGEVFIEALEVGSPADKAGIKPKDQVLAVDGKDIGSWDEMAQTVKESLGKELSFTVKRQGSLNNIIITPVLAKGNKGEGKIGVLMGTATEKVAYGPIESVVLSLDKAGGMTGFTVTILSRLVRGKEDASQLGGPIAIVQMSGSQAKRGFADFVLFMALLSINLGILNLLPVPILDGGHLLFFAIEGVIRKPVSLRVREVAQQIGLFLLISLMVFVFYNDIMRLLGFEQMWK